MWVFGLIYNPCQFPDCGRGTIRKNGDQNWRIIASVPLAKVNANGKIVRNDPNDIRARVRGSSLQGEY